MPFCESPEPVFTPSMLDALLARWKALPGNDTVSRAADPADRMNQARSILRTAVESQFENMSPGDQALYARLLAAREAKAWRTHLFDCFDLMARASGAAIAVLKLQELHQLLRDAEPISPRPAAVQRPFASACA